MLDIQLLRSELELVAARLAQRGLQLDTVAFQALEEERRQLQTRTQQLQSRRNALSKQIGVLKGKGEDASAVLAEVGQLGDELKSCEQALPLLLERIDDFTAALPNLPHESVPVGEDESGNVEVRRWGTPRSFDFEVRDHVDLGVPLGLDFDTGARLSGSRFSFLRGPVARLHRALAQFMLDVQTGEHGYTECYTPYIVNREALVGTGQLPKFREDMFWVLRGGGEGAVEQYLISTSEIRISVVTRAAKRCDLRRPQATATLTCSMVTPAMRSACPTAARTACSAASGSTTMPALMPPLR